jgi:hypothetical protein
VRPSAAVDTTDARKAIEAGVEYLDQHILPTGQFVYLVNSNPSVAIEPSYNMLRHAGAIYALSLANAVVPDGRAVALMQRSTSFMRSCCFEQADGHGLALSEPAAVTHGKGRPAYKLGGIGLGIVGLSSLERAVPNSASQQEMLEFARFGRYMMRWTGEFAPRYVPSAGGRDWSGDVLYYPGEMVLGWMALYDRHPSPELMQWSVTAMMNLARERASAGKAPADHWSLLATADMIRLADRNGVEIPRQALINHALLICDTILEEGYAPPAFPPMDGALVAKGHVISTAARLEGLLAALTFVPRSDPMHPHIESAVNRGIAFLMRAQVQDGPYRGGFPLAIMQLPKGSDPKVADFNAHATEIRLDHMQHCMSAIARYIAWRETGKVP